MVWSSMGPTSNDAGDVDEDVDALEVAEGLVDHEGDGGFVGEVGGEQEAVGGELDGAFVEEGLLGLFKVGGAFAVEDEAGVDAGVAAGEGHAEAGRRRR